ncbi:MAG TPA: sulfotransferase [Acetobacteraceae bacterium]|nr:sulfotransferase [Acetobacteraceae bacterium]
MISRALKRLLGPASSPVPGPGSLPADQGLFIIGAARSGTTILQNALNDSPEIFLFGEANLHTDPGTPDFAARYNAMHRSWHNQETKSSFCPPVLPRDSYWHDYMRRLAAHHRLVGSKTVLNPVRPAGWLERLFAFHCQHFYQSRYIFTFRDPVATILSTRDLQVLLSGHTEGLRSIMRNYVDTVLLFVSMLRALPNVRAVCHEDIDRATFDRLEAWLGVSLPNSHTYYDRHRVLSYDDEGLDDATRHLTGLLRELYGNLRQGINHGFATPQLDQNNHHLSPTHLTKLGHVARQAEMLADGLPAITSPPLATWGP